MKTLVAIALAMITLPPTATQAADIATKSGTIYKGATITSRDAASVSITHASGVARVPIPDLPDKSPGGASL